MTEAETIIAEEAWMRYHGKCGDGYIPQMPPAFLRGFAEGATYEALRKKTASKKREKARRNETR